MDIQDQHDEACSKLANDGVDSARAVPPRALPKQRVQAKPSGSSKRGRKRGEDRIAPQDRPFIRAENEDDDGYDPYSDRRPHPEPLFERDPWD